MLAFDISRISQSDFLSVWTHLRLSVNAPLILVTLLVPIIIKLQNIVTVVVKLKRGGRMDGRMGGVSE